MDSDYRLFNDPPGMFVRWEPDERHDPEGPGEVEWGVAVPGQPELVIASDGYASKPDGEDDQRRDAWAWHDQHTRRRLPTLRHLDGSPSYEVDDLDGVWCWSIETATENWEEVGYTTEADAVGGAWEHAASHFGIEAVRRIEFRYLDSDPGSPLTATRTVTGAKPRRMSFFLTTRQVLDRTKTVTRRSISTWSKLKAGDRLVAIEKGQGLKAGEGHHVLALLEVVDVRVELLDDITAEDCAREGFPEYSPAEFVAFYRRAGKGGKA